MRIAVTGSSGLIGTAATRRLADDGHLITRMVRSREAAKKPDAIFWDPAAGEIDLQRLPGHDAVINLAGENMFGLWTAAKKQRIYRSRVDGTRLLAESLAGLADTDRPRVMINASAVGYYGDRPPDQPLDEAAPPGESFAATVVRDWEAAADPARGAGIRVLHLRFGLALDADALLIRVLGLATRLGLGATIGDGRQPFPWVTADEIVRVVAFALDATGLDGAVNVVAPEKTTNREFVDSLARVLHRPRFLAIPRFAMRLGGEFGRELTAGAWVVPRRLEAASYEWREPSLEPALRRVLRR